VITSNIPDDPPLGIAVPLLALAGLSLLAAVVLLARVPDFAWGSSSSSRSGRCSAIW